MNMADLAGEDRRAARRARSALAVLLLVVFGIKAAMFPLFFWLPDSYPTAPSPVTAIFAGLLTKVGVYAIIRTQTLLFPGDTGRRRCCSWSRGDDAGRRARRHRPGRRQADPVVPDRQPDRLHGHGPRAVHAAGLAAAVFYTIHHIVVKTTLFLVGGLIEHAGGSSRLGPPRRHGAHRARDRRAVPRAGAEPGRHPADVGVHRQVRAGRRRLGRARPGGSWRGAGRQPADAVLDHEDLDRVFWSPADPEPATAPPGRRRTATAGAARS